MAIALTTHVIAQDLTWHVDDDAPGGDGTLWSTAFNSFQDALDVAADPFISPGSDLIKVAQGTYVPDFPPPGIDPRNATCRVFAPLLNNLTIEGGYAGITNPNPDVRNPELFETVLSGALPPPSPPDNPACGPGAGPCDQPHGGLGCEDELCCEIVCNINKFCCILAWDETCVQIAESECGPTNAYHVVIGDHIDNTVRFDGLTIQAGFADGTGNDAPGGGMF